MRLSRSNAIGNPQGQSAYKLEARRGVSSFALFARSLPLSLSKGLAAAIHSCASPVKQISVRSMQIPQLQQPLLLKQKRTHRDIRT
jgi:hypothetical protein